MNYPLPSDGETTDEEYQQDYEQAAQESDVCSDLDEQEQVEENKDDTDDSQGSSNQNSDEEERDSDSEDDIQKPSLVKKSTGLRILDSDEEDEDMPAHQSSISSPAMEGELKQSVENSSTNDADTNSNSRTKLFIPALNHDHSMSMFDTTTNDNVFAGITRRDSVQRRSSILLNSIEPSMPPLMLSPDSDGPDSPFGSQPKKWENGTSSFNLAGSSSTFDLPKDSGMGTMATNTEDDNSQMTLGLDESACKEACVYIVS